MHIEWDLSEITTSCIVNFKPNILDFILKPLHKILKLTPDHFFLVSVPTKTNPIFSFLANLL